ncbi:hypothetical protein N658DRAFT_482454 [Parathielavia hyrcaniae]|uniref:Uncharacterized protein n=1 Tax=Parathielavia hyrcaniae TaxID=113614 RepID=A0AAN6QAL0_9PEZI|nr:hypothetical protein N658DRAFT_482454 [Parathielavia hyrcaniae]
MYRGRALVDAAFLVEAAIAQRLPWVVAHQGRRAGAQDLAQNGTVVIHGPRIARWKDHRQWTPRRAQNKGFDFYRETTTVPEEAMGQDDIAHENTHEQAVKLYVGPYGSEKERIKKNGLVKKTISFVVDGHKWGVVACYTMAAATDDILLRPRSAGIRSLPLWGDCWDQMNNENRSGAHRIVVTDDGNVGRPDPAAAAAGDFFPNWAEPAPAFAPALAAAPAFAPPPVPAAAPDFAFAFAPAPVPAGPAEVAAAAPAGVYLPPGFKLGDDLFFALQEEEKEVVVTTPTPTPEPEPAPEPAPAPKEGQQPEQGFMPFGGDADLAGLAELDAFFSFDPWE